MSNYCTKCQSFYSQPGTCNCYAGAAPGVSPWSPITPFAPTSPQPWKQPTPTLPYIGDRPWLDWPGGTWVGDNTDTIVLNDGNDTVVES